MYFYFLWFAESCGNSAGSLRYCTELLWAGLGQRGLWGSSWEDARNFPCVLQSQCHPGPRDDTFKMHKGEIWSISPDLYQPSACQSRRFRILQKPYQQHYWPLVIHVQTSHTFLIHFHCCSQDFAQILGGKTPHIFVGWIWAPHCLVSVTVLSSKCSDTGTTQKLLIDFLKNAGIFLKSSVKIHGFASKKTSHSTLY